MNKYIYVEDDPLNDLDEVPVDDWSRRSSS